jgi:FkbM family methyltransferase
MDFHRASLNFLVNRYASPNRLRNPPPLTDLPGAKSSEYIGNVTVWDCGDDPCSPPKLITFQKRDFKAQHAVLLGDRLAVCGTDHLEVCDLSGKTLFERTDPWFSGGHTICRTGRGGEVAVSCSGSDAVLLFDLSSDRPDATALRIPEPWYGRNYDLPRDADLHSHYIHNDLQRTHINSAVPLGDGFLVSMLIPGAVGILGRDGTYRELTRGFVGCHGARMRPGLDGFYFADSCLGALVEMDWSGRVLRRFAVATRWLHDVEWVADELFLFCLSDTNSVELWDVASGRLVWSMKMDDYGENTQFSSIDRGGAAPAPVVADNLAAAAAAAPVAVASGTEAHAPPAALGRHHPVILAFAGEPQKSDETFEIDFVGARHRRRFFNPAIEGCPKGEWGPWMRPGDGEYFEWIALLAAVEAAQQRFTMVELGAGWGRWLLRGAAAARLRGKAFRMVGVEADPDHFEWMKVALADNSVAPADCALFHAAVAGRSGTVWFQSGNPASWYGQAVIDEAYARELLEKGSVPAETVRRRETVTLEAVAAGLNAIDLLDMDIQGAEAEVVESSLHILDRKVTAAFVSTHGTEVEERLRTAFHSLGWIPVFDFRLQTEQETAFGRIPFADGVQLWVRPDATALLSRLIDPRMAADFAGRLRASARRLAEEAGLRRGLSERLAAAGRKAAEDELRVAELADQLRIERLRIRELLGSRWRRLGQKIGVAGRTDWESAFGTEDAPVSASAARPPTGGEYRLAEVRNNQAREVSGTGPVRIVTDPAQWTHAATIPFRRGSHHGPLRVRVRGRIEAGEIGVAVVSADGNGFVQELSAAAGPDPVVLEIRADSADRCGDLIIRNWAGDGTASVFTLESVEADPTPPDPAADEAAVRKLKIFQDPFAVLQRKWGEVPAGRNRVSTAELLAMDDRTLLEYWTRGRSEDTDGPGFSIRGWYHEVYRDLMRGKKVLDIGCGLAFDSLMFASAGAHVTFVDIVADNVELVRRLAGLLGAVEPRFLHMPDVAALRTLPDDYDVIWAGGSLINAPTEVMQPEVDELVRRLRVGGRWIELGYPKSRWEREGRLPLWQWGKVTDGSKTPWMEWYDLHKRLATLRVGRFDVVMYFEFHNGDFNWFDLLRRA